MHSKFSQWNLLDYVIVRKFDMQKVCNVKSLRDSLFEQTVHSYVPKVFRLLSQLLEIVSMKLPKRLDAENGDA